MPSPHAADDDLRADYQRAGLGGGLTLGERPALLVVDMARAYFEADAPLYIGDGNAADVLASVDRVAAAARAAAAPVIFTEVAYHRGGVDGGIFFRKVPALRCFEAGNRLGELMPPLRCESGDVMITKQYASAFFGTSLAAMLTAQRIDTLLIVGVSTSGCVRASALDACQHGFIPLVVRDACGDRAPGPHESNLFDLQAKYAEVRSEADTLDYLASVAAAS